MTFEEKLTFIKNSINGMKSNLGLPLSTNLSSTGAEVADVKDLVDSIINDPSLSLGIYKVASIAERDNLNAVEGDICLVYGTQDRIINQNDTELTTITFPETIVLESQMSGNTSLRLRPTEGYAPEVQLSGSGNAVYVSIMGDSEYYDFTYTSQDGLNFNISGTYPENRTFTTETPIGTDPNTWEQYNSEPLTPFIHVIGVDFGGLFIYKGSSWEYLDIGIYTTNIDVISGKQAYSSSGLVNGALGTTINLDLIKGEYNNICRSISNYSIENLSDAFKYFPESVPVVNVINTTNTTNMVNMFFYCNSLIEAPYLDMSNCTNTYNMFYGCANLTRTANYYNTSKVTNLCQMFVDCASLTELPMLELNSTNSIWGIARGCTSITNIPNFNTSNIDDYRGAFSGCTNLVSIPLINTSKATTFYAMFFGCTNLTSIPELDTSNITSTLNMFRGCVSLENVPVFNLSKATNMSNMFTNANRLSDSSLSNILKTCTNAVNISNKKLSNIGITNSTLTTKIQSLPEYSAFTSAGWTIN